ncbi:hypothetical protein FRC11_014007 [Ceratobasidium sp. 423]|nr:hypothetical protein FRC11_014007 [Ceratobasidium sp. 423]
MRNSSAPVSVSNTQASTGVIIGPKAGVFTQSTVPGETLSSSDSEAAIPPPNQAGYSAKFKVQTTKQQNITQKAHTTTETTQIRSVFSVQRQINELSASVEELRRTNDSQHARTDEKLMHLLETVRKMVPAADKAPVPASAGSDSSEAGASNTKIGFTNPKPTPETITLVSKVVTETRLRIGKKKGNTDDNSVKEHARSTFYRMLGIVAAKDVRPYFEDEHGEPDTLPAQFMDPDGYCQPFPHWRVPLTKQVAWVLTYIERFRLTIPNDDSELSNKLRSLTDEQIIVLLNDGPFKSGQTAWRDMKKSSEELGQMRSQIRRYLRAERKASIRASYFKHIESLQGPEWEYLSHPGFMSPEVSDSEGTLVTERADYRAQWVNNLYDGVRMAEVQRMHNRPGSHSRLAPRGATVVKRPIPQLERGTGGNKVTVRIAACSLSKSWRATNADNVRKYAHLLDMKITAKPRTDDFLAQHPLIPDDQLNEDTTHGQEDPDYLEASQGGLGEADDEGAGEESGLNDGFGGLGGNASTQGTIVGSNSTQMGYIADSLIDPQLQDLEATPSNSTQSAKGQRPFTEPEDSAASYLTPESQFTGASQSRYASVYHLQMPPPPPLPPHTEHAVSSTGAGAKPAPKKRGRKPKAAQLDEDAPATQADPDSQLEGVKAALQPKKRGRPSKASQLVDAQPIVPELESQLPDEMEDSFVAIPQQKKRGRPVGSKNKK